jgi:hypothetical protein
MRGKKEGEGRTKVCTGSIERLGAPQRRLQFQQQPPDSGDYV